EIGYPLKGNCSSPLSYPAMNLTWYLNGKRVKESFKVSVSAPDAGNEKRKPVSTIIGLEHEIDASTFKTGKAVIRCAAEFFHLYQKFVECTVDEERPRPRPSSVLGTRDTSSGSQLALSFFTINTGVLLAVILR
ncbi:Immunoglobulin, partial [Oryctes borbonicus]